MDVAIAGGHGQIALQLTRLLSERGDSVRSLIRNPDHEGDVEDAGGTPVICDLEADDDERVARAVGEVDAIVFAAGAGPGSGTERKETMDYGGAVKLIEAAKRNGIGRYVIVSSMGADASHEGDETFDVYLRAKGRADEDRVAEAVGEAEAVVFAAGAGPGSGPERKETMDHLGAVKLIEAARHNHIPRYVIVSSMGADAGHEGDETFDAYLRAKGKADDAVRASGLDYVIVKPGMLTDDPPTGKVDAGDSVERGSIPRADVAAVLAALLADRGGDRTFEVVGGTTPIERAFD